MKNYNKLLIGVLSLTVITCGGDPGNSTSGLAGSTIFNETFTGTNNDAWPNSWTTVSSGATLSVDIQNNRGRLQSNAYDNSLRTSALTRVINNSVNLKNSDVVFTVEFENFANQGIGFYARQNGGYLTALATNGQGYGVYWQGNTTPEFDIRYELNGVESVIAAVGDPLGVGQVVLDNTAYKIRFKITQINANSNTELSAKVWLASDSEPATWNIKTSSSINGLQDISGGFAVDAFNYSGITTGSDSIYIDDIIISN
ncbi:hypothetical protein MNBD_GAMMA22-1661 [hydrothermal vent metagenome]|uniref:Uncharacterized protein n=1 Tax=hydrothermal vent metagenome TaxID=652676 RepID=A0A3B0ZMS2_9ZZZZ